MTHRGFYFDPVLWMGDSNIMLMDWDCKGMHIQLIAFSWQQEPVGHILYEEEVIRKIIGNPSEQEWENRIKKQLESVWKIKDINSKKYWVNEQLVNIDKKQRLSAAHANQTTNHNPKQTHRVKTKENNSIKQNTKRYVPESESSTEHGQQGHLGFNQMKPPFFKGIDIASLKEMNPNLTIFYEKAGQEQKNTIWGLGVNMMLEQEGSEQTVRSFIARLIKTYGEKEVASAIVDLNLLARRPADIKSYLVAILRNRKGDKESTGQANSRRGMVAL